MTEDQANAVYDLLTAHAGAKESQRDEFLHHMPRGCTEFRFQGALGFGGKFYPEPRRWRVGCYREDLTPQRQQIIDDTNAALAELRAAQPVRDPLDDDLAGEE